jgi:CRP/FNR family transcriptional regulator, cyclic AMP receptor protein
MDSRKMPAPTGMGTPARSYRWRFDVGTHLRVWQQWSRGSLNHREETNMSADAVTPISWYRSLDRRHWNTILATKVFGALAPAQIKHLGSFARPRRIASGTTLFVKGDPGTALFAVVSGTVKITVPSIDGREVTFNLLHAGDIFGEIALLDGQPRTADAIAATECELMVIERRDFLAFVQDEPKLAMKLIELLCARLRVASAREEEVAFLNLPARLARLLLRLLGENAAAADKNELSITQQKISEVLGTTRESVNKHLQIWARRRMIALKRGAILVLAPQALAAIVSGDDDGNGNDSGTLERSSRRRSEAPLPLPV